MSHPQSATSIDELLVGASGRFQNRFHCPPSLRAAAPGRVNLIGEHTDYNDGYVLPIAIARWTAVVAAPIECSDQGHPWTAVACDLNNAEHTFTIGHRPRAAQEWHNYVRGVVEVCRTRGVTSTPLNLALTSSVPIGSGLSSSAALEVAVATLLEQAAGRMLDPATKARLCWQAEHEYVGVPCGIMDQTVSCLGRADHALLLDCRSGRITHVPMPDRQRAVVMIIDTKVRHDLATTEYAGRHEQCQAALTLIGDRITSATQPPPASLRDVTSVMLDSCAASLDPLLYRRARHVITETDRTQQAAQALHAGNLNQFGRLMNDSHVSLRDDYQVSCAELDTIVESAWEYARAYPGAVFGCRMTGGGFGGCAVALCHPSACDSLADWIGRAYRNRHGLDPDIFITHAVDGACAR